MRIRIALVTAIAVAAVAIPAVVTPLVHSDAASAQATRHEAASLHPGTDPHQGVRINDTLMSYSEAREGRADRDLCQRSRGGPRRNFYEAVTFYKDLAFFQAVAAQQQTIPAAWMPTAVCEEGGRNDPYAGYFGILEWNGFDGYPTAGSAPVSVQLSWEAAHGQGPPDGPGQCHSY